MAFREAEKLARKYEAEFKVLADGVKANPADLVLAGEFLADRYDLSTFIDFVAEPLRQLYANGDEYVHDLAAPSDNLSPEQVKGKKVSGSRYLKKFPQGSLRTILVSIPISEERPRALRTQANVFNNSRYLVCIFHRGKEPSFSTGFQANVEPFYCRKWKRQMVEPFRAPAGDDAVINALESVIWPRSLSVTEVIDQFVPTSIF